jgi:F0F1-type ATP synthase assembly protein I
MKDLIKSGPLLQLGWVVALSALLPIGLGLALDRRLGTAPLFIIVGALVGILASTIGAVRIATRAIDAVADRTPEPDSPSAQAEEKED